MANIEPEQKVYDNIKEICLEMHKEGKAIPVNQAFDRLMHMEGMPMHCPYHHFILPAAMLTMAAVDDGRSEEELSAWLEQAEERAKTVPGGFCGNCGTCGSGVGMGIFASVYTETTPLSTDTWSIVNSVTGTSLVKIAEYNGPRCCKRTAYLAATAAVPYLNEKIGTKLTIDSDIKCEFSRFNAECLLEDCPFFKKK